MNKGGQITVFIIVGVLIVAAILLIFLLINRTPENRTVVEEDPNRNIEQCISKGVEAVVNELLENGGQIGSYLNMTYQYEEIPYLCYTNLNYARCINRVPMLVNHIQGEINKSIDVEIDRCFDNFKREAEMRAGKFDFSSSKTYFVEVMPGRVNVQVVRDSDFSRAGESRTIREYNSVKFTRIYDMVKIVERIIEKESTECHGDLDILRRANTWADIDRIRTGDDNIIYTIKDRKTNEEWRFAVRGCVLETPR